jgi:hypothetical protein
MKKFFLPSLVDEEDQIEENSPDQQSDDDDIQAKKLYRLHIQFVIPDDTIAPERRRALLCTKVPPPSCK